MKTIFGTFLLLCLLSLNPFSQSTNATLGGTVQDPSGAYIPGVTVTATNNGTGIITTVVSNEAGAYQFASLQPRIYESIPAHSCRKRYDVCPCPMNLPVATG